MSRKKLPKKNAQTPLSRIIDRFCNINPLLPVLLAVIAGIGVLMLYSAAGGKMDPWARPHLLRFVLGSALLLIIALSNIRLIIFAAYPFYIVVFGSLIFLEIYGIGSVHRWLDIGIIRIQPSEPAKIALILVLARYFHYIQPSLRGGVPLRHMIFPLLMVGFPFLLVMRQPDLGTALVIGGTGAVIMFLAGVHRGWFMSAFVLVAAGAPVIWNFFLKPYQRERVLTFIDPARDPQGSGYHTIQSITAIGSGGTHGLGYLGGMQSQLNFLPEKETDFIFTMFAEEFGLIGGILLLLLYAAVLMVGIYMVQRCRHRFGRLVIGGVFGVFFIHAALNIAMTTGVFPIVGLPLPLVSYGGTSLLSFMIGFGLAMNAYTHWNAHLGRPPRRSR